MTRDRQRGNAAAWVLALLVLGGVAFAVYWFVVRKDTAVSSSLAARVLPAEVNVVGGLDLGRLLADPKLRAAAKDQGIDLAALEAQLASSGAQLSDLQALVFGGRMGEAGLVDAIVAIQAKTDAKAAVGAVRALLALLPGELLITEIMFDPAKVNDLTGEWFEVYNATAQDITLCKGWVFRDEGTDSYSNLNDIVITPGGRSLFVRSGDGTVNGGLPSFFDLAWGGAMSLSNTSAGDEIVLELDGVVIDRVAYTPWAVSGHAMQLDQAILDALDPSNPDDTVNDTRNPWCEATQPYGKGDLGTPGTLNDVCP